MNTPILLLISIYKKNNISFAKLLLPWTAFSLFCLSPNPSPKWEGLEEELIGHPPLSWERGTGGGEADFFYIFEQNRVNMVIYFKSAIIRLIPE